MSIGNQEFGIPRKYQYQIGIWYLCLKFFGICLVFYRNLEYDLVKSWFNIGIFQQNKNRFGIWFLWLPFRWYRFGFGLPFSWKWHLYPAASASAWKPSPNKYGEAMEGSGPHKHSILRNKEVPKKNAPHKPRDVTRSTVMVKRYGFRETLSIKYKIDFWNNPITASALVWNQVVLNQSQQLGYLNSKLMLSWDCPFNSEWDK